MTRKIIGILFVSFMSLFVSCGDEPDWDYGDFLETFATYEGSADGHAVLTCRAHGDSPLQTLTAENVSALDAAQGERVFIRYTKIAAESERSFRVRIDGAKAVINDVARQAAHEDLAKLPSDEIDVTSLWRSGDYLNLNAWVPYSGKRFRLMLVADESTLGEETVEAVLTYSLMEADPAFERLAYASFSIRAIWQRESCRVLRVRVNDPTGNEYYEFYKQ